MNTKKTVKNKLILEALGASGAIGSVSDREFDDILDRAVELAGKVTPLEISTREERVAKIKKMNTGMNNRKLDQEDKKNKKKEQEAKENKYKAAADELGRYKSDSKRSCDDFEEDLRMAMEAQVRYIEDEEDSWGALNRRTSGTPIVKPGSVVDDVPKGHKPLVQVYLDCSGSFDEDDIHAEEAFMSVIADLVDDDKLDVEIVYFANNLHPDFASAAREGGTNAWDQLIDNIEETQPDNVLIITDSDMDYDAEQNTKGYIAPGCVWFIWKIWTAPHLTERLQGMAGTYEYDLGR